MNRHKSYIVLVLALGLGACKISKDLTIPEVVPDQYRNAFANKADTATIGTWGWKRFFPDVKLQELIAQAMTSNYDLQTALRNLEVARLQLRQSKWGQVPQLDAYVSGSTSIPSKNSFNGISVNQFLGKTHIEDYNAGLSLSWEADIWGKINNRKKEALASYLQTDEARKAIQANIVASVAEGYYNLLMLDAQLEIAKRNRALSEKTAHIVLRQFEAAQVTHLAVEQAEAQKLQASQIVPRLEKQIIYQENALSILTGVIPSGIARDKKLTDIAVRDSLSAGIPALLLSNRPDVKSLEYELDAANARVGIAKASMYPALNITASGGLNSLMSGNWFNIPASLFGTIAGSITQPLLEGRKLRTKYEIAKVEREKVVLAFKKQVLLATGDVSDALTEIDKLHEEVGFANERVNNLQKAVNKADKLFSGGLATYLEIITAQSNVLQSELELATIKRDRLNAEVKLYKALGGGWNQQIGKN